MKKDGDLDCQKDHCLTFSLGVPLYWSFVSVFTDFFLNDWAVAIKGTLTDSLLMKLERLNCSVALSNICLHLVPKVFMVLLFVNGSILVKNV